MLLYCYNITTVLFTLMKGLIQLNTYQNIPHMLRKMFFPTTLDSISYFKTFFSKYFSP